MAMEGLGRLFNVVPVAQGVSVSLKEASGVTFICYGAAEAFTLTSSATAAGSQTNLATIDRYQLSTSDAGAGAWATETQTAGDSITLGAAGDAAAIYVDAGDLPSGAEYVRMTHTTSGLVVAILHDLRREVAAPYLAAPAV